jgi:hypothetical protein
MGVLGGRSPPNTSYFLPHHGNSQGTSMKNKQSDAIGSIITKNNICRYFPEEEP